MIAVVTVVKPANKMIHWVCCRHREFSAQSFSLKGKTHWFLRPHHVSPIIRPQFQCPDVAVQSYTHTMVTRTWRGRLLHCDQHMHWLQQSYSALHFNSQIFTPVTGKVNCGSPCLFQDNTSHHKVITLWGVEVESTNPDRCSSRMKKGGHDGLDEDRGTSVVKQSRKFISPVLEILQLGVCACVCLCVRACVCVWITNKRTRRLQHVLTGRREKLEINVSYYITHGVFLLHHN